MPILSQCTFSLKCVYIILFDFFLMFETFVLGFVSLLSSFCTSAVLGLHYVICCNPVCWYSEGKHVPFALPAPVPPTALGRLQVHSHRLWILLHIQYYCLPHWLWNPVPAGELQLQDGSYAWYEFRKAWPNKNCSIFPNEVFVVILVIVCILCHFEQEPPQFAHLSSTKIVLTQL